MKDLIIEYNRKRPQIKKRLKEFQALRKAKDEDIFAELCFCILTPQSKALLCDEAVKRLKGKNALLGGKTDAIRAALKGLVRFHNNKAAYITAARKIFGNGSKCIDIKSKLNRDDIFKTRDWLANNIKGIGYKEASHFLRNIGLGRDIAILDVHILKNLKRYGVIRAIPAAISKKNYLKIEDKMREFAERINIPLEALDLLFWSRQTGFIFK